MTDEERIGYGRPPRHGQFKKGQSGNPKGRPQGTRNLKTDLAEELAARIRVREGDQAKAISKQRAMLKALLAKAIRGDTRAATLVLSLMARYFQVEEADLAAASLPTEDRAILEEFQRRCQGKAAADVSTETESDPS